MTRTAATASPVLDFEVRMSSRRGAADRLDYRVFDIRTGHDVQVGTAPTREEGVRRALAVIATRSPSRVFVLSTATGWSVMHPEHRQFLPLPLTAAATGTDALRYVEALPFAAGRAVEVCDVAALAASFIGH